MAFWKHFPAQVAIKRITISKAQSAVILEKSHLATSAGRVLFEASANVKLEVELGEEPGSSDYTLYLMSDSYQADSLNTCQCKKSRDAHLMKQDIVHHCIPRICQGCDQEYNFKLNVKAAP